MTPRTLRRKLQKKLKHKPHRKCPKCGRRMQCRLLETDGFHLEPPQKAVWRLFKSCGNLLPYRNLLKVEGINGVPGPYGCGYYKELFWSGGETGRHIPPAAKAAQDASA